MLAIGILVYIITAFFIGWIYKFIVGILSFLIGMPLLFIVSKFRFHKLNEEAEKFFIDYPKLFLTYSIVLNAAIGSIYATIIVYFTKYIFIAEYGGLWIFTILLLFWAISIISEAESFHDVLLFSSLGGVISLYLGFGLIIPFISVLIYGFIAYFKRVDEILREEFRYAFPEEKRSPISQQCPDRGTKIKKGPVFVPSVVKK